MYRSFWSYDQTRFFYYDENNERHPTGHVFGVIRSIITLRQRFNNPDIILCRDGLPKDRIELLGGTVTEREDGTFDVKRGEYKEGRAPMSYNIHKDAQLICDICSTLPGVYYAYDKFKESDDLMYSLAKTNEDRYDEIYVFSGDNDLLQTITDKIKVLRSMAKGKEEILDSYWVKMKSDYKVLPHQLPIFRSLRGDVSDTIEGVYPRLSKDFARHVAENFSSVEDIEWYMPDKKDPWYNWWMRIKTPNATKILERNYKLMKLNVFPIEIQTSSFTLDDACLKLAEMKMNSYAMIWRKSVFLARRLNKS